MKDEKSLDVRDLSVHEISPNKDQPRKTFDKGSIENLARSIEEHGIIQPIIVRRKEFYYEIIAGERRWRAAKSIGLKEIPAIIKTIDDFEVSQIALVENIQRENLNPIEEAMAFKAILDEHGLTQERVAELLGKSRSYVANIIRLLNLDQRVKNLIIDNKLTSGHGRTILGLNKYEEQIILANIVLEKNLSVRETESLVKKFNKDIKQRPMESKNDHIIKNVEASLMSILGTKVQITRGKKKGKIEIEYYSEDELQRIIDLINR